MVLQPKCCAFSDVPVQCLKAPYFAMYLSVIRFNMLSLIKTVAKPQALTCCTNILPVPKPVHSNLKA